MTSIQQCLDQGTDHLQKLSDSPRLDTELLLMHVLNCSRTYLYTWPEKPLEIDQIQAFSELLTLREKGNPIAHIIGHREFWGLELNVNAHTLIPRPDTEVLVETTLLQLPSNPRILDLGTGSGAIALAIASELKQAEIIAIDKSVEALKVAQSNAKKLNLNVTFVQSDWFTSLDNSDLFDCIVSNPPYIENHDPHLKQGDVRFEPITALTSGDDGLQDIQHICLQAGQYLKSNGILLLEHGYQQKRSVQQIFRDSGFVKIETVKDYGDNDRVTLGYWK